MNFIHQRLDDLPSGVATTPRYESDIEGFRDEPRQPFEIGVWETSDITRLFFRDVLETIRTAKPNIIFYETRPPTPPAEVSDLGWFASNPPELAQYIDKYVAIFHRQIVGWGDTVKEASVMAKEKVKEADPLIAFIEENYDTLFLLGHVTFRARIPFYNDGTTTNRPIPDCYT